MTQTTAASAITAARRMGSLKVPKNARPPHAVGHAALGYQFASSTYEHRARLFTVATQPDEKTNALSAHCAKLWEQATRQGGYSKRRVRYSLIRAMIVKATRKACSLSTWRATARSGCYIPSPGSHCRAPMTSPPTSLITARRFFASR